jgi:tripartite-type tricarboxylate transporter receptor subunit TctC
MPRISLTAFALACVATLAHADYPDKQFTFVVPFAAGSATDQLARSLGQEVTRITKQAVIVDNKPGASGFIGAEAVKKAAPDGYTVFITTNTTHAANEHLFKKIPYDPVKDYLPVTGLGKGGQIMIVNLNVPAKSVAEFIALAKSQPGKLNYASSGPGTPYHMAGELFKYMAGVDIVHVPHKGSDQARTAILGGQVQMMFDAITTMAGQARAGKVKALASSGKARSAITPETPTVAEAGVPGYEATIWLGLMAPAGTPRPLLDRLSEEVNKIVNSADVKEAWGKQGAAPMGMSVDQFGKFLGEDIQKWSKLVKDTGMKVD